MFNQGGKSDVAESTVCSVHCWIITSNLRADVSNGLSATALIQDTRDSIKTNFLWNRDPQQLKQLYMELNANYLSKSKKMLAQKHLTNKGTATGPSRPINTDPENWGWKSTYWRWPRFITVQWTLNSVHGHPWPPWTLPPFSGGSAPAPRETG